MIENNTIVEGNLSFRKFGFIFPTIMIILGGFLTYRSFLLTIHDSLSGQFGIQSIIGILLTFASLAVLLGGVCLIIFMRKARLFVQNGHIHSESGLKHPLDIPISSITYAWNLLNAVRIRTKDGKYYTFSGLTNSKEIYSAIFAQADFATGKGNELQHMVSMLETKKKYNAYLIFTIVCSLLFFVLIWLTVVATENRSFSEFTPKDNALFGLFIILFLFNCAGTFYFAAITGQARFEYEYWGLLGISVNAVCHGKTELPVNTVALYFSSDYRERISIQKILQNSDSTTDEAKEDVNPDDEQDEAEDNAWQYTITHQIYNINDSRFHTLRYIQGYTSEEEAITDFMDREENCLYAIPLSDETA